MKKNRPNFPESENKWCEYEVDYHDLKSNKAVHYVCPHEVWGEPWKDGKSYCIFHHVDQSKDNALFHKEFEKQYISGDHKFPGYIFPEGFNYYKLKADLEYNRFIDAVFFGAQFYCEADFSKVRFIGFTNFMYAEFYGEGTANFMNVVFAGKGDVNFSYSEFHCDGGTDFRRAMFLNDGNIYFESVKFMGNGGINLSEVKFSVSGSVDFTRAEFMGNYTPNFSNTIFDGDGDVKFNNAIFIAAPDFNGIRFSKIPSFKGAEVDNKPNFDWNQHANLLVFDLTAVEDKEKEPKTKKEKTKEPPDVEDPPKDEDPNLLSPHITGDMYTTDDALGYRKYAEAIVKFIKNENTKPPLTISIQSPWGGGKTSLMKMIQEELDPVALKRSEESEEGNQKKWLTNKEIKNEFKKLVKGKSLKSSISIDDSEGMENLTIWFNVWKYENTEQVWAGLADAIVSQFAERLDPVEREKFWFSLNMRRVGASKTNKDIMQRMNHLWLNKLYPWLMGAIGVLIASLAAILIENIPKLISGVGGVISALLAGIPGIYNRVIVNCKPAKIVASEYLRIPEYSKKLGFIHHVEEDLDLIFDVIQDTYKTVVIFVDDLDRCSPGKVAELIEGINLFLAGESKDCFFILGIDSEMVAAALTEAHCKVMERLPEDDSGTPIGWRFMDKFVQLPFVIPIPREEIDGYIESLFLSEEIDKKKIDEALGDNRIRTVETQEDTDTVLNEVSEKYNLDEDEKLVFTQYINSARTNKIFEEKIKSIDDKESQIKKMVVKSAKDFSANPRELKRFINMFSFTLYLNAVRESRRMSTASDEQIRRWIVLSLKWPEVIRWLRRGFSGRETGMDAETGVKSESSPATNRLKELEGIAKSKGGFKKWKSSIKDKFDLDHEKIHWVNDEELFYFFKNEPRLKKERLSAATDLGLL